MPRPSSSHTSDTASTAGPASVDPSVGERADRVRDEIAHGETAHGETAHAGARAAAQTSTAPIDRAGIDTMPGERNPRWFGVFIKTRSRKGPWWRARLPALMLAGTLALTLAASGFVQWSLSTAERARFDSAVQYTEDRVTGRIRTYTALLYGVRGLFAASHDVTADEFRSYVERLELGQRYPGIQGIGFSLVLDSVGATADSATLVRRLRMGGSLATHVWPDEPRDEHHGIVYLEPRDRRNLAALGYDMHTDPTRREAMERARDLGEPAASGAVTLKQEIEGRIQRGFLIYVPVYAGGTTPPDVPSRRAALRGFVYSPFRLGDLFNGIFGAEAHPNVAFRVFDGTDTTRAELLFASPGASTPASSRIGGRRRNHVGVRRIDVGGHAWTLVLSPRSDGGGLPPSAAVGAIALFGVLLGVILYRVTLAEVRAREAAEHADAVRSRFFAAMSHELRTPVNAILGYNDLLLARVYGPLAPSQEHGIQRSQRAARHLLELVNDVLDLSKIEAGKMEIVVERVALQELLDDLLVTIRPMAEQRGCELRLEATDCAADIETDPRRLRQILLNLLSNATKFGAGGPVIVRCRRLPRGAIPALGRGRRRTAGDAIMISVTDRGPGIAPADQERIFEEFVQLPGATPGGTGLGLPISRRLAELLGGHLSVESTLGRGSTFALTIPLRRSR